MSDLRPDGLGDRGSALWDDLGSPDMPARRAVLLGEACRLADRLDSLDLLLSGDAEVWTQVVVDAGVYELRIDAAAAEARLATSTLRLLLQQLTGTASSTSSASAPAEEESAEDDLERRRAARRSGA